MQGQPLARLLAICVMWLTLSVGPIAAQTLPSYTEPYITDHADLLTDRQEATVRAILTEVREETGIEFAVLTIRRMSDYGHTGTIESFAALVFNDWGIGDAATNDGVLMLISADDRQMRVELGAAWGRGRDADMKDIVDGVITAEFRLGNYPKGIEEGARHIIRNVAGVWPGQFDAYPVTRWWTDAKVMFGAWLALLLAPAGWFAYRLSHAASRRRPLRCPEDGTLMWRVLDEFEAKHLTRGQQLEEDLRTKEYDVWKCETCQHVTVKGFRRWFKRHKVCDKCGYHTLQAQTQTLSAATQYATGLSRTTFDCKHCKHSYAVEATIPMITVASSSSGGSSGGGSFGGGSSGGGGASGSW